MFKLCKREQGNEAGSGSREHRSSRDDHCVYDRSTSNYLNTKTRTKEVRYQAKGYEWNRVCRWWWSESPKDDDVGDHACI